MRLFLNITAPTIIAALLAASGTLITNSAFAQDLTQVDQAPPSEEQVVPVADEGEVEELGPDDDAVVVNEAPDSDGETPVGEAEPPADESGALVSVQVGPAEATDEEELMAEFRRFQDLMANESIDEADNVAKRVVELAIRTSGPRSVETAKALTNLGIVQHRTEQYEAAIQNFEGAIEIIEDNTDRLDAQLLNPLKGLGAAQLGNERPDQAVQTFQRAVHITHVNEGPHNIDQVEILESLAETNLLIGNTDDARDVHELIYNLNERYYRANMLDLVPSLMRRAKWQHRTGYYNDERATYRRVIRILEAKKGKNDLSLIEPLQELGRSYYFIDVTDTQNMTNMTGAYSGEIYFKRAVRIAEDNDEASWVQLADTKLALADYFMKQQSSPSARKIYREVWDILSVDEERLPHRERALERVNILNAGIVPEFAGDANRDDLISSDVELRQGKIALTYSVSMRGRVSNVELVENEPPDFPDMLRFAQREVRARVYRPRFVDGEPVDTGNQLFSHTYYYRVAELEALRAGRSSDGS